MHRCHQPKPVTANAGAAIIILAVEEFASFDRTGFRQVPLVGQIPLETPPAIAPARRERLFWNSGAERGECCVRHGAAPVGVTATQEERFCKGVFHPGSIDHLIPPQHRSVFRETVRAHKTIDNGIIPPC